MKKRCALFVIFIILLSILSCEQNIPNNYENNTKKENNIEKINKNLYKAPITKEIDISVLDRLNYYRKGLGLPKIDLHITLNKGADLHNEYMIKNNTVTHFQDPSNPAYNSLGAKTGLSSVLAGNVNNGIEAIDLWMNSLYHRQYLLSPTLENVGFSYIDGFATLNLGDLGMKEINFDSELNKQLNKELKNRTKPIAYPFDNQKDIPTEFDIIESPNPIPDYLSLPTGPFITLTFDKFEIISKIIKVNVSTEDGNNIDIARFLAKNKEYVLAILPEKPLPHNTKIIVDVELEIKLNIDKNKIDSSYIYKKVWSFTTAKKSNNS